jgi:hypothetical protein
MAGTTEKIRPVGVPTSAQYRLIVNVNKLIDDVELLRAAIVAMAEQIDADNGTIGTDYAAAATIAAIDTAAELLAAKIGNDGGTAYS